MLSLELTIIILSNIWNGHFVRLITSNLDIAFRMPGQIPPSAIRHKDTAKDVLLYVRWHTYATKRIGASTSMYQLPHRLLNV